MRARLAVWRARRAAKIISKHALGVVNANVDGITVGKFKDGREVRFK